MAAQREELFRSEFLDELKQFCEKIAVKPAVNLAWDYLVPLPVVKSGPGKAQDYFAKLDQ